MEAMAITNQELRRKIVQRQAAEGALRQSEERFRQVAENAGRARIEPAARRHRGAPGAALGNPAGGVTFTLTLPVAEGERGSEQ
jgi:Tfp pilus assembly protein PilX